SRIIGVDDVEDAAVVLEKRRLRDDGQSGGDGVLVGVVEVAAADHGQRIFLVDGPRGRAGQPIVAVGIKAVVQRGREGERTQRVVGLYAAADDRLLVPQQTALDVHVLKSEGVFGADQGRQ